MIAIHRWYYWYNILVAISRCSFGYRILGVFPHYGYSHYKMFEPIIFELAKRGHDVVLISRFPPIIDDASFNITFVDVNAGNPFPINTNNIPFESMDKIPLDLITDLGWLLRSRNALEGVLRTENFQNFLKSKRQFDVVITESFQSRLFYVLAHKFEAPLITLSSCPMFPRTAYDIGNPLNPSFVPVILSPYGSRMTFWQRLGNLYYLSVVWFAFEFYFDSGCEKLKEKYFGPDIPRLHDIARNTSLTFVNTHFSLNMAIPLMPGVVEIGGLALKQSTSLPKEFETFINESKHGVVYFCMGSLLRGETFPEEKRNAFLYAFSKIPQRVLWKWEGDILPGKSDNIKIAKWMPQRDILAHPNVKLFISHGGLLGTTEAVYEGVPVLGIPIFGDQRTNIKALEAHGSGEMLDYNEISNEVVLEKIQKLLNDPRFKEKAKQLSERYRDRPMSPLDTAVYWTEYVIRHKGAPHLKSAAIDLAWYQYLLLDVIAFIVFVLVVVLWIVYICIKKICRCIASVICGGIKSQKAVKLSKKEN